MTNVPTPEEIARERRAAIGDIPEYSEEEKAAIWDRQAKQRKEKLAKQEAELAKNKTAEPATGSGSAVCSPDRGEGKAIPVNRTNRINNTCCQVQSSGRGKITKWGAEITERAPAYSTNVKIANTELTLNERNLLGLLNSLMARYGYAFASYEQLAYWLGMKPKGIRSIMDRLRKAGLVTDISKTYGKHRWVVTPELQNPKKKSNGVPF